MPNSTFLSQSGLYTYGQQLIISSYLQPFTHTFSAERISQPQRTARVDGLLEREIHGAMHAARVASYIPVLHGLLLAQIGEDGLHNMLRPLTEFFDMSMEAALIFCQYAALGHDAGRAGDGEDIWETDSAELARHFLLSNGMALGVSDLISKLILFKDNPSQLTSWMSDTGYDQKVISGANYLRLLVSLADAYDVIRCREQFDFNVIRVKLAEVFPGQLFDEKEFKAIAKYVLTALVEQGDLYFDIELVDSADTSFRLSHRRCYSLAKKLRLEHADNVLVAMLETLSSFALARYEPDTLPLSAAGDFAQPPCFNPFLLSCSSADLIVFIRAHHQVMPSFDMLTRYGVVPSRGRVLWDKSKPGYLLSLPVLTRLNNHHGTSEISLEDMLDYDYQDIESPSVLALKEEVIQTANQLMSGEFIDPMTFRVTLSRFILRGGDIMTVPQIDESLRHLESVANFYYLYMLLAKHFDVDKHHYEVFLSSLDKPLMSWCRDNHVFHLISNMMKQMDKSPRSIWLTQSDAELVKLHLLLNAVFSKLKMPLWTRKKVSCRRTTTLDHADNAQDRTTKARCYASPHHLFWPLLSLDGGQDMAQLEERLTEPLSYLEEEIQRLHTVLAHGNKPLTTDELSLVNVPIPIILIYPEQQKVKSLFPVYQEYVLNESLILEKDIPLLATDTQENARKLQTFLQQCGLNISVILFEHLFEARQSYYDGIALSVEDFTRNKNSEYGISGWHKHSFIAQVHAVEPELHEDRVTCSDGFSKPSAS